MNKCLLFITVILASTFIACNKATPAGFWKNYKRDFISQSISDQGPYGGHRALFWKTDSVKYFDTKEALEFAKQNGWTLIDSTTFNENQTSKWIYSDKPVFPLTFAGFSDTVINSRELEDFPLWFDGKLRVYRFKTGWITIEPGTNVSFSENGFIVISNDKTKMAVYHLWGE